MTAFTQMKVGTRLMSAFVIVAAISGIIGAFGIWNMGTISDAADRIYERELLGLSHIKEAHINMIYIGRASRARPKKAANSGEDWEQF